MFLKMQPHFWVERHPHQRGTHLRHFKSCDHDLETLKGMRSEKARCNPSICRLTDRCAIATAWQRAKLLGLPCKRFPWQHSFCRLGVGSLAPTWRRRALGRVSLSPERLRHVGHIQAAEEGLLWYFAGTWWKSSFIGPPPPPSRIRSVPSLWKQWQWYCLVVLTRLWIILKDSYTGCG